MTPRSLLPLCMLLLPQMAPAVMERGDYPWEKELCSHMDQEMADKLGGVKWLLNLGPTGIRARIYPDKPKHLVVKYVFQDAKSPAKGLVNIDDVIVGANGENFSTEHRFGRNLPDGGGWDGPLMELAGHIEDSQGKDGVLELTVWPQGDKSKETRVKVPLRAVGRFADTFPYDCERSTMMLEELCDFLVDEYESDVWKNAGTFGGGIHTNSHSILALMASGNPKYDRLVKDYISNFYAKEYDAAGGGFQMWTWGYDGIVMGEYYLLEKDRRLLKPMESLANAMPDGCHNGNGIYTHRSYINLCVTGKKPYASIAAISGLQMVGMSLFKEAGLPYHERLYGNIHQHYLNSATPDTASISYAFGSADKLNDDDLSQRHAIIVLKDKSKGRSGKGPGFICPTGMDGIGEYEVFWPTKKDPRWKPLDWLEKEADTNIVTEHSGEGIRRVDRNSPKYEFAPEPKKPYSTTQPGSQLAPVGMGAVAHMIGNNPESWQYLGAHAANTCALAPGNAFDGHAASNQHGFWSVVGAALSDQPETLRAYFDYMKTFLILSETHNGGLILQPWGRDRPDCNSDISYGPRVLPTATGAILLALGKKHIRITGGGTSGETASANNAPSGRKARTLSARAVTMLDDTLIQSLGQISQSGKLEPIPLNLSKASAAVWLAKVESNGNLVFQAMKGEKQASFGFSEMTPADRAQLAKLVAARVPDDLETQAMAGLYMELVGNTKAADGYYQTAGAEITGKLEECFE